MTGDITYTVQVGEDKAGTRLDRLLAEALDGLSRTRLKGLIEGGQVLRRGHAVTDAAAKVAAGETYSVQVPPLKPAIPEAQAIPLDVIYEDDDLIVIDKPAGLVVHPAAGNPDRTLVNALLAHCRGSLSGIGGVERPGIVHRLDKDTGGLMVAAKNDMAHHGLAEQFAAHTLERAYNAVVWGMPEPRRGEIDAAIGRSPANRQKMAVVRHDGKRAVTRYEVLRPVGTRAALIECRLLTGRTHQIRVHMTERGHPIVGDPLYGNGSRWAKNLPVETRKALDSVQFLALHAVLIGFTHPRSGQKLRFETELSNNFKSITCILDTI